MESYTAKDDGSNKEVSEIEKSCYETLYLQGELQAQRKKKAAKDIPKQFHEFANFGFLLPVSTLVRKANVKKGKLSFSDQQLKQFVNIVVTNQGHLSLRRRG